jgi:hypothetical protein
VSNPDAVDSSAGGPIGASDASGNGGAAPREAGSMDPQAQDAMSAPNITPLFARAEGNTEFITRRIVVDDTRVYWSEANVSDVRIMAGSKDGGAVTDLGQEGNAVLINALGVDDEYVYSMNGTTVRRIPKTGGEATELELGGDFRLGALVVDDDALYVANHGCANFVRLTKADASLRPTAVSEPNVDAGGGTALAMDGTSVYCTGGGLNRIVRLDKATGDHAIVVTEADITYEAASGFGLDFGGVALSDAQIYFLVNRSGASEAGQALHRCDKDGDNVELLAEYEVRGKNGVLRYDVGRDALFWVSGDSSAASVLMYDVGAGTSTTLVEGRAAKRGFDTDADFLYWTEVGGILKLPKPN